MPTCGDHIIHPQYQGKHSLAYDLMNLPESHGSSYFKVRMSSSMPSSFGYHKPRKLAEKHLDVYKLMVDESSLARQSKASVMREVLIWATRLYTYIKKIV